MRATTLLNFTPRPLGSVPPHLGPGDLHLWRIQTQADEAATSALWPVLAADEQARALRLATATLRARYIRAHAGLRRILGLYLDRAPGDLAFIQGPQGKPALAGTADSPAPPVRLEYNLTGSGDLALVAVSLNVPVGVDCEQIRPCRELLGVAQRMFSPELAQALAETPEPERLDAFYTAWTALEAEVKADGRGLFRPRDRSAVAAPQPLSVTHFRPLPGFIAAVARHDLPPVEEWGAHHLAD